MNPAPIPELAWPLDNKQEHIAVAECQRCRLSDMNVPTGIAIKARGVHHTFIGLYATTVYKFALVLWR